MVGTIIALTPIALLLGYIGYLKSRDDKAYPISTREGKHQLVIVILLLIMVAVGGTWDAFMDQQTKRGQYIQLLILYAGPAAILIGFAAVSLQDKLKHSRNKSRPSKKI